MNFSPAMDKRLERYRAFFADPRPGQMLVTVCPYTFDVPPAPDVERRPLSGWNPAADAERMAENAVRAERHFAEYTKDVDSDYVPNVCAGYGVGMYSAMLSDAPVIPGIDTSWIRPCVNEWSDMDRLRFDPGNRWMDFVTRFMRRARELSDGDYCVTTMSCMAPSDMANALRGNQLFYDVYDEPDMTHRLLGIARDAILDIMTYQRQFISVPEGGFTAGGMWLPGNGFYMSEDAADLCSPALYDEFFGKYTQSILDRTGAAYIHHHAYGWKVHARIAALKKLTFAEFSWDPNKPRPVDHLEEVFAMSGDTPVQIRCTLEDLRAHADEMQKGRVCVMVNVNNLGEAKEAVRIVRAHSSI